MKIETLVSEMCAPRVKSSPCVFLTRLLLMDSEVLQIEEVVVGEGTAAGALTEVAPDGPAEPYSTTTLLIQEPPAPSIIQPYQHENLQCFQCFITFCNSKAKERHMKKSHREEYKQQLQQCDTLFTCYVCDRTFSSSEELTQHQGSHNKEDKPFKCSHCQESFRTFSELTSHRRQVCPERQFVCRDCAESFRGPALLRSHRLAQHPPQANQLEADDGTKTHRCGKCNRGFETEAELLQHQENHAGDQHCNGSAPPAKRRGRPPKTEETADGEKKAKRRKKKEEGDGREESGVSNHAPVPAENKVKGRRGRPPKVAQEAPAAPDPEQAEETKAKVAAAQPRQHACPDCELTFPGLVQLRVHKKEKHSRPPPPRKAHACGECEESFARPEQLEAHRARAHSAGRYACPTCGKSFGRESNLKAHRQTHAEEGKASDGARR
ncbi:zinc finger protein 16-like [Arapaima gigas]